MIRSARDTPEPATGPKRPSQPPPLVLVLDSPAHLADERARVLEGGLRVVEGWSGEPGVVCTGLIADGRDAANALLAVIAGAGLVVEGALGDGVIVRLCDDLRRFGSVRVLTAQSPRRAVLTRPQREILTRLSEGETLGSAASALGLPRRTADRRLAEARMALGVATTAEALVAFSRDHVPAKPVAPTHQYR